MLYNIEPDSVTDFRWTENGTIDLRGTMANGVCLEAGRVRGPGPLRTGLLAFTPVDQGLDPAKKQPEFDQQKDHVGDPPFRSSGGPGLLLPALPV